MHPTQADSEYTLSVEFTSFPAFLGHLDKFRYCIVDDELAVQSVY